MLSCDMLAVTILVFITDFIQPVRFGLLSDHKFASEFEMNEVKPLLLVRSVQNNLVSS